MQAMPSTNEMLDALIRAGAASKSAGVNQPAFDWSGQAKSFVVLASGQLRVHFDAGNSRAEWAECRMSEGHDCMPLTAAILSGREIKIRATALTMSTWFEVSSHEFLQLLQLDDAFRKALFQSHARLLPCYLARASADKTDRFDRRLADWLLRHAQTGVVQATHKDIANDLLTAREVVSRGLRGFAQRGWITQKRGTVCLTAPAALMRLAKGRFSVPEFDPMLAN